MGYEITFIGFRLGMWADEIDAKLSTSMKNITFIYLDATRSDFFPWLYVSIVERIARWFWKLFRKSLKVSTAAHTKRSLTLLNAVKHLKEKKFDLVIAHNLPALYPAYILSSRLKCPFAFDVEDFHPGEVIPVDPVNEKKRREFLMAELLPQAAYVSGGSPLIAREVQKTIPLIKNLFPIINSFPSSEFFIPPDIVSEKMKLIWFSQNISAGRGLEFLIEAWPGLVDICELTLIGRQEPQFTQKISALGKGITILDPMNQEKLHSSLGAYDIGLALELSAADLNKQLALSNKMIAYAQAGLYVLATDTPAQAHFVAQYPFIGEVVVQDAGEISIALNGIFGRLKEIRKSRISRFEKAKQFSWEVEATRLQHAWSKILSHQ